MNRWEILNLLIHSYNYKKYLEIGYYKGWCFDKIDCYYKLAVDPFPCKNDAQIAMQYSTYLYDNGNILKSTSDDFFTNNKAEFDIIFIDGMHERNQVLKDIENSLKILSPNGIILLHDCNPPTLEHVTTGTKNGEWNGNTYQAILEFRIAHPEIPYFTIIDDWGCGLITKMENFPKFNINKDDLLKGLTDWEYFDQNRENLLSLKPFLFLLNFIK
jgi:SAM-dependent methyltransferase